MNKKKLVTTLGSLALVGAIGVGATLAYLTDQTANVTNTFNLSDKTTIYLDEQNMANPNGDRIDHNEYIDVIPGMSYDKDPTVTVANANVRQYVFMAVKENDNVSYVYDDDNWIKVSTEADENNGFTIYRYKDIVNAQTTDNEETGRGVYKEGIQLPALFTEVTINETIEHDNDHPKQNLGQLLIRAASIQADGLNAPSGTSDENFALQQVKNGLTDFSEQTPAEPTE